MKVIISKANLLKLRNRLRLAESVHELLQQKKDALILKLTELVARFKSFEENIDVRIHEVIKCFEEVYPVTGSDIIKSILLNSVDKELELDVEKIKAINVYLPVFSIKYMVTPLHTDIFYNSLAYEYGIKQMEGLISILVKYIELVFQIKCLAIEIEKTQRSINALENVLIPDISRSIQQIQFALEETERQEIFRIKNIKKKLYRKV